MTPLLEFRVTAGYGNRRILDEAAFDVLPGEVVGLAGPSGCGKSTCGLAVLGLLGLKGGRASGVIRFDGLDLLAASERELRGMRGRLISLVPQSPIASLNPALRLSAQLKEAWQTHAPPAQGWLPPVRETLAAVSLPTDDGFLARYPRELSVGLAQRVLIAMAILHKPKLIIADEATSALDLITQSEILNLFDDLRRRFGLAILYISHDLLSMARLCQRVAILSEGRVVEFGAARDVFERPKHEYARKLIGSLPVVPGQWADGEGSGESLIALSGGVLSESMAEPEAYGTGSSGR